MEAGACGEGGGCVELHILHKDIAVSQAHIEREREGERESVRVRERECEREKEREK